jgi:Zn-dependent M28 family amino/carboxypeptidase
VILTRLADELADEMLNKRIRVVFFDQEEIGLVGSRAYLEAHADDNIDAMVNLDVNGYGDTVFFGPVVDQEGGFMQTSMESACRAVRVDCVAFGRVPASDHQSFEREFIPMLQISLLPKVEVEALNAMLNPASAGPRGIRGVPAILALIHTAEDTSERIDPAGMALTFNATLELVRTLDR